MLTSRRIVGFVVVLALLALGLTPAPSGAVEQATGTSAVTKTSATFTMRGGVSVALVVTANNPTLYGTDGFWLQTATAHSTYNATAAMFYPGMDTLNTPTVGFYATAGKCGSKDAAGLNWTGFCPDHGTVTVDFGRPVTDPIMDISGLGGYAWCSNVSTSPTCPLTTNGIPRNSDAAGNNNAAGFSSMQLDIASGMGVGGAPVNVDFANLSAGATNLAITTKTLQTANKFTDSTCNKSNPNQPSGAPYPIGIAAAAGCGSVTLKGTFTSVTFNVGTWIARSPNASWVNGYNYGKYDPAATGGNGNADLARLSFRLREDTGDAPATYEGTQAAVHFSSGLTLGSSWTEDSTTVRNPIASALSGPASLDTDDAINDGVVAPGGIWTKPYALDVPIAGARQAGTLSGWIDFNNDGTFAAGERAQATFAAGDTTATLTWPGAGTPTTGTTDTYLRLRVGYTASEVANPNGIATSGEVEDYRIRLVDPVPHINITKKAAGTSGPNASGDYTVGYDITVTNDGTTSGTYTLADTPDFAPNLAITDVKWERTDIPGPVTSGTIPMPAGGLPVSSGPTAITDGDTHVYHVNLTYHYTNSRPAAPCAGPGTGLYNSVTGVEDGPTADNDACLEPPGPPAPGLHLKKRIAKVDDIDGDGEPGAGDLIWYEFELDNTGDVTLAALAVNDPFLIANGISITCPTAPLAPGSNTTCTSDAGYEVTGDDVNVGEVRNTATSSAEAPYGDPADSADDIVSNESLQVEPLPQHPSMRLDKRIAKVDDVDGDGDTSAGDLIWYEFQVANTGDVDVTSLGVKDPMLGKADIGIACPEPALAPGKTVTCTADVPYVVTAEDVAAGTIVNTAHATGTAPGGGDGGEVSSNDDMVTVRTGEEPPPADPSADPPADQPDSHDPGPRGPDRDPLGWLPDTGGPMLGVLIAGGTFTLLGAGLVLFGRKRRSEEA